MGKKTISSTKLRDHLSDVMKETERKKDFFIITKKGLPKSAIVDLDFFEDLLAATNKEYLKNIKEARDQYKKGEISSFDEVFGDL